MNKGTQEINIQKYTNKQSTELPDTIAIEEPLEISIGYYNNKQLLFKQIAVTMRTPGNDVELALGFLFTENIIDTKHEIEKIETKGNNKICVFINGNFELNLKNIDRNFYTTSSCGVCGKASIESIKTIPQQNYYPSTIKVENKIILSLRNKLDAHQSVFKETGGIHAAALFTQDGEILNVFEDVGRHNALDKLIGNLLKDNKLECTHCILLLSGRASFELIQKAVMAQIPIVCAIGAPSSLAVELAKEFDITLIGFLKNNTFNVYNGVENILQI